MSCLGCSDQTFLIVTTYSFSDDRFIRNTNSIPYCLWCHDPISSRDIPIVLCKYCNVFVGHESCKNSICMRKPCPYCNE